MPPCPLIAERTTTSSPCLTRGIQAARSPIFGAPPTPVPWHLMHRAWTICFAGAVGCPGRPADRLGPVPARLIDHVGDGALDFGIGEIRVAAMRRHLPDAVQRILRQAVQALRRALRPGLLVADPGRAVRAAAVAGDARGRHHFLAAALDVLCRRCSGRDAHGQHENDRDDKASQRRADHRACHHANEPRHIHSSSCEPARFGGKAPPPIDAN